MRYLTLILLLVGAMLTAEAAFSPEEARRIYGESSLSSGWRENGDYLFLNVKWNDSSEDEDDDSDVAEMRALLAVLTDYVRPSPVSCTSSPFIPELTSWLMPKDYEFSFSDVESCLVDDRTKGESHDVVFAFDLKPLKSQKKAAQVLKDSVNKRREADWVAELKKVYNGEFRSGDSRRSFFMMLGCPIVSLIEEKTLLATPNIPAKGDNRSVKELSLALTNETSFKSWFRAASALASAGCHAESVWAYARALSCEDADGKAWWNLYEACKKAGYIENAKGISWYLKIR